MKSKLLLLFLSLFAFVGGVKAQNWTWTSEDFTPGKAYYFKNKQHNTFLGVSSNGSASMNNSIDGTTVVAWSISANSNATFSSVGTTPTYYVNDGKIGTAATRMNFSVGGNKNDGYEVSYTSGSGRSQRKWYIYCDLTGNFGQSWSAFDNYRDWILYSVDQKEMRDTYIQDYNNLRPQANALLDKNLSSSDDKNTIRTALNNAGSASMTDCEQKITDLRSAITTCTANNETKIAALTSAIADKDKSTSLGFLAGEYAPYNNASAIAALNEAKAIDVNGDPAHQTVVDATTALNNATWTANTTEVNAIYDGTFSSYTDESEKDGNGRIYAKAWGNGGTEDATNVRIMIDASANAGLNAASSGKAIFMKFNTTYGEKTGYTLPLKAGLYTLKFKFGGWGENHGPRFVTLSKGEVVVNPSVSSIRQSYADAQADASHWDEYYAIFKVVEAGDYVLNFTEYEYLAQNQIIVSDIELFTFKPEARATVSERYGTICLPYDFSVDNAEIWAVKDITNNNINLVPVENPKAGVPYIYQAGDNEGQIFNYVENGATVTKPINTENNLLVGTFARIQAPLNSYVLQTQGSGDEQKQNFYVVGEAARPYVPAYRSYIKAGNYSQVKALSFGSDDVTTAIVALQSLENGTALIFDLNGRRLSTLQKGVNVVNGKKFIVK